MQAMLGGYIAFAIGRRLRSVQGKSPLHEKLHTQWRKANRRTLKARDEATVALMACARESPVPRVHHGGKYPGRVEPSWATGITATPARM